MKKVIIAIALSISFTSQAQDAYTLKFLPQLFQSQWSNASNQTDSRISVGIPILSDISFNLYSSGFSYHSLFTRVNDTMLQMSPGKFIDHLKSKNIIGFGTTISLLSANYATPDYSVGFSVNDKVFFDFNYPKDLLKLLWNGNGPYIGQTLDIGKFGINAAWYREYALHLTKNYKKWTFGASPKLLFGKANIYTKKSSLNVYTDSGYYAITATADMNIETSGFSDSADNATGRNKNFSQYFFNSHNTGLAIDLGARYEYSDKISFAAGINNLGYIHWKEQVHNFVAGPSSAITFNGFPLEDYLQGNSDLLSTSKFIDTVRNLVTFQKNSTAYSSPIPYELFAVGSYKLDKINSFHAQLNMERYYQKSVFGLTLGYEANLTKHFTGALSYTGKSNALFNLGGAIILRFAGMQWYFATDNWWASVKPLDSKNTNLHLGMNLVFGDRVKKK